MDKLCIMSNPGPQKSFSELIFSGFSFPADYLAIFTRKLSQ